MLNTVKKIGLFFLLILTIYASWVKLRAMHVSNESYVGWEGFIKSKNFRDTGESVNLCYGSKLLKTGVLSRSNAWFSGWDCDGVGNPDAIFTLNYIPSKPHLYFCHGKNNPVLGQYFSQTKELADLEFLETWNDIESRTVACKFLTEIMTSVIQQKKTLIHCDAGRDRTGALSAILSADALEPLDDKKISAIECDYRVSKSLKAYKFGRIENFLHAVLNEQKSIAKWLENTCNISQGLNTKFRSAWKVSNAKS